jgi:hypothetical protein
MSTQPPLPTAGQNPWDAALNNYLTALESRATSVEGRVTSLETVTYRNIVNPGPFTLPLSAAWRSLPAPGPVTGSIALSKVRTLMLVISCDIDSMVNNNQIRVGLDLTGATVVPVGSKPEQNIWIGGKQAVQSTMEVTYIQTLQPGTTNIDTQYNASQANAVLSNLAVIATVLE